MIVNSTSFESGVVSVTAGAAPLYFLRVRFLFVKQTAQRAACADTH
jgi:hypothetical protein